MRLYQPPLFSEIHSLKVPLLHGTMHQMIRQAAPETNKNSELWKLKRKRWDRVVDANIVLVHASVGPLSSLRQWALRSGLYPAHLGHLCSLAAAQPLLHRELSRGVQLIGVVGTQYIWHKCRRRMPLVWWTDNPISEKPPERIASLLWYEEEWEVLYWYAFVREEKTRNQDMFIPA